MEAKLLSKSIGTILKCHKKITGRRETKEKQSVGSGGTLEHTIQTQMKSKQIHCTKSSLRCGNSNLSKRKTRMSDAFETFFETQTKRFTDRSKRP